MHIWLPLYIEKSHITDTRWQFMELRASYRLVAEEQCFGEACCSTTSGMERRKCY